MPKPMKIALEVSGVEVVAFAADGREAVAAAINLLALHEQLKPGWTLRVEEAPSQAQLTEGP